MAIIVTIISNARDEEPRELVFPKSEIRIGRGLYNDIVLDSLDVSTNHAILTVNDSDNKKNLTVTDLGSSSGTRLEGAPIPSRFAIQMSPSQRIEIGGFIIRVDFLGKGRELEITGQAAREIKMKELKDLAREPRESSFKEKKLPFGFSSERPAERENWREALFESSPSWGPASSPIAGQSPLGAPKPEAKVEATLGDPQSKTATPPSSSNPPGAIESRAQDVVIRKSYVAPWQETAKNEHEVKPAESVAPILPEATEHAQLEQQNEKSELSSATEFANIREEEMKNERLPNSSTVVSEEVSQAISEPTSKSSPVTTPLPKSEMLELGDMEIEVPMNWNLYGTVVCNGVPLPDVGVSAGSMGNTSTDSSGKFCFEHISEGTSYSLGFEKPGYRFFPDKLEGSIHAHSFLYVSSAELSKVRGKVVRDGVGVQGVSIDAGNLGSFSTANDGSFEIPNVFLNSYLKLSFEKDHFVFDPEYWEGFANPEKNNIEIKAVQLIALTGRLLRAGKPLSGIEIDGEHLGKSITGPDGRYTFFNVREDMNASLVPCNNGRSFQLKLSTKLR